MVRRREEEVTALEQRIDWWQTEHGRNVVTIHIMIVFWLKKSSDRDIFDILNYIDYYFYFISRN